jgi:hypothetical protein
MNQIKTVQNNLCDFLNAFSAKVTVHKVYAGNVLKGEVTLDATPPDEGYQLFIRFIGYEKTCFSWFDLDTGKIKQKSSLNCFVEVSVPLQAVIGVSKGKHLYYTLPFDLNIPSSLPPSTRISLEYEDEGGNCQICYFAEIIGFNQATHKRSALHREEITLSSSLFADYSPSSDDCSLDSFRVSAVSLQKVKYFGCFRTAKFQIAMHSSCKTILSTQSSFDLFFIFSSLSSCLSLINAVEISFIEETSWKLSNGCNNESNYTIDIENEFTDNKRKKSLILYSKRIKVNDLIHCSSSSVKVALSALDLKDVKDSDVFYHCLQLPKKDLLHSSFNGQLVEIHHFIKLKVFTSFGLNNCQMILPIRYVQCDNNDDSLFNSSLPSAVAYAI